MTWNRDNKERNKITCVWICSLMFSLILFKVYIIIVSLFAHYKNSTYIHWFKIVNIMIKRLEKAQYITAYAFHQFSVPQI